MKTRAKSFLKTLVTMVLFSTLMVGCGKENESGGGNSNNTNYNNNTGIYAGGNGNLLPSNWLNILENENTCNTGYSNNSRVSLNVQATGQINTNANALHVGVTEFGDILIISSNQNNQPRIELRLCNRNVSVQQAHLNIEPVIVQSRYCSIGEITAADILVQTQNGPRLLEFYPVGFDYRSSLCQN